jgi:hypothetical protein
VIVKGENRIGTTVFQSSLHLFERHRDEFNVDRGLRSGGADDVHSEPLGLSIPELSERREDLRIRNPHRFSRGGEAAIPDAKQYRDSYPRDQKGTPDLHPTLRIATSMDC